tara:strand:+ start:684 stop:1241 length:558 start_codon:yes stop_codon:yes gene_type:complete
MRIISGKFKGKKIFLPKESVTRPLKDLVKESIFNIIIHSNLFDIKIEKSNVLDLFAGVGSFGLECLSRGSLSVTFFENHRNTINILKKNISSLNLEKETNIFEIDIMKIHNLMRLNEKFDIIFLDPPYKEKNIFAIIDLIFKINLLKKGGIIILHRHKMDKDLFPSKFNILKEEVYGLSKIIFGN